MKGIGIGESDFRGLITRDNYYIDKTMYIKNIIDNQSRVILITRPRRFGKTLNMSTLKYYFDCKQDNKNLFNGLKIMSQDEKYTSKLGAYPVIYLTLKDVAENTYENMLLSLKIAILDMYKEHRYLLDSDKIYGFEKKKIENILYERENENEIKTATRELSEYLNRYYEKPVILLIDEYDVPIQSAHEGYYEEEINFLKAFYRITFKDNPYLEKTVLTGVSRVAKESIFSGANNFKVFTVLDNEFADDFGITEEEMDKVIEDFQVEDDK